eukprot:CAMPEP_0197902406 /NCGR_PEP_ID=MMETSP1439-20131203/53348_1 /TAXON_ID=66791 /ORGANISM="Gonyaulax spinifera, Strain CCMP409" /LENGTH=340 /DNA_ID=CAMNT_0043523425 /DNA_START=41 /DNA_END=1063 /DNA_ORIENTATION=+
MTQVTPNVLLLGEVGDGRDILIDDMSDKAVGPKVLCFMSGEGVSKSLMSYRCNLDGMHFNLIDTPGIGGPMVTPMGLISLLMDCLSQLDGGIQAIVVTTPVPECRMLLGLRILQLIVHILFAAPAGRDTYASVILAGTKSDKADEEDKRVFENGLGDGLSLREQFFKGSKSPGTCRAVMVCRGYCEPLLEAIRSLPKETLECKSLDPASISSIFADHLGMGSGRSSQDDAMIPEPMQTQLLAEETHRQEMPEQAVEMSRIRAREIGHWTCSDHDASGSADGPLRKKRKAMGCGTMLRQAEQHRQLEGGSGSCMPSYDFGLQSKEELCPWPRADSIFKTVA